MTPALTAVFRKAPAVAWRLIITLALLVVSGCGRERTLPTAPSELTTGIIVYEHANFLGQSAHITSDIPRLSNFSGPCAHNDGESTTYDWNDCISSARVASGWRATLYRGADYKDDSIEITADMPNLQLAPHDCPKTGLNDCVSSVRVRMQ